MNESLLKLSIEVPLNALPYHEFLFGWNYDEFSHRKKTVLMFSHSLYCISCDHDA